MKKRKGSALFTLVMIFSVLILMSTGVLALTNLAAQTRTIEKKRKVALYASETSFEFLEEELNRAFLDPTDGIYVSSLKAANTAAGEYAELLSNLLRRKYDIAHMTDLNTGAPTLVEPENFDDDLKKYLNAEAYDIGRTSSDIYSLDYHLFMYLSNKNGNPKDAEAEEIADFDAQIDALIGDDAVEGTLDAELSKPSIITYADGGKIDLTTAGSLGDFIGSDGKFTTDEEKLRERANAFYVELFDKAANEYVENVLENTETKENGGYTELEKRINAMAGLPTDPSAPNFATAGDDLYRTKISIVLPEGETAAANFAGDAVTEVTLTFRSEKLEDNGRIAVITASYAIKRPEFQSQGLYNILGEVNVNRNVLQGKAIAANGGVTIENGTADINGAVFSGNDVTVADGAVLNMPNGQLLANGNINIGADAALNMTGKSVLASNGNIKNTGDGAKLNFNGSGDTAIYLGGSLTADARYSDAAYTITGDLYTGRNIELDGGNTQINITGDYYGYSYGCGDYDTGSRIRVNDIEGASHISIKGENVLIAGTAYVTGLEDSKDADGNYEELLANGMYQTGESVAVKGNYAAYGFPIFLDGESKYYFDKMTFKNFAPLYAVYSFRSSEGVELTGFQKAVYFAAAAEDYAQQKANGANLQGELINTAPVEIDAENIITNGIYIGKQGKLGDPTEEEEKILGEAENAKNKIEPVKGQINTAVQLINSHGFDDVNNISEEDAQDNQRRYKAYAADNKIIFTAPSGTVTIKSGERADIEESNGDYTITVGGGFANIVLVTGGDVIVESGLTLVGSIIANGHITINGGTKIYSDEETVLELLALDKFDNITARELVGDDSADDEAGPIANQFLLGTKEEQVVYRRVGVDSYYKPAQSEDIIRLTAWE